MFCLGGLGFGLGVRVRVYHLYGKFTAVGRRIRGSTAGLPHFCPVGELAPVPIFAGCRMFSLFSMLLGAEWAAADWLSEVDESPLKDQPRRFTAN